VGTARSSRVGEASWYIIPASWEGLCTTCPDTELTAASPWIPFGTRVKVVNLSTGAMVTVVINDRGPFGGRLIDLSEAAFSHIAPLGQGVAQVRITW
jgi:rare lipoprotein A